MAYSSGYGIDMGVKYCLINNSWPSVPRRSSKVSGSPQDNCAQANMQELAVVALQEIREAIQQHSMIKA